jgi:hypothetical protein
VQARDRKALPADSGDGTQSGAGAGDQG